MVNLTRSPKPFQRHIRKIQVVPAQVEKLVTEEPKLVAKEAIKQVLSPAKDMNLPSDAAKQSGLEQKIGELKDKRRLLELRQELEEEIKRQRQKRERSEEEWRKAQEEILNPKAEKKEEKPPLPQPSTKPRTGFPEIVLGKMGTKERGKNF